MGNSSVKAQMVTECKQALDAAAARLERATLSKRLAFAEEEAANKKLESDPRDGAWRTARRKSSEAVKEFDWAQTAYDAALARYNESKRF